MWILKLLDEILIKTYLGQLFLSNIILIWHRRQSWFRCRYLIMQIVLRALVLTKILWDLWQSSRFSLKVLQTYNMYMYISSVMFISQFECTSAAIARVHCTPREFGTLNYGTQLILLDGSCWVGITSCNLFFDFLEGRAYFVTVQNNVSTVSHCSIGNSDGMVSIVSIDQLSIVTVADQDTFLKECYNVFAVSSGFIVVSFHHPPFWHYRCDTPRFTEWESSTGTYKILMFTCSVDNLLLPFNSQSVF